jgi:hypothetical protein
MRYSVTAITMKGWSMIGADDEPIVQPLPPRPLVSRPSVEIRWALGALLVLIGIAAIVGVVVAAVSGQPTIALIIALLAGAFFSRVAC